jgi:hypothetical protein
LSGRLFETIRVADGRIAELWARRAGQPSGAA